jgi:Contractile injection system tube protein
MTSSPQLLRGGVVLLDPASGAVQRVIAFQYNPDTLTRTLAPKGAGGDGGGDRSQALRLTGPPAETIKLDAELDATDALERPDENSATVENGLQPQIAALEMLLYPDSAKLQENHTLASFGTLEITPVEAPLVLLVWGRSRVVPVRLTDFSVTEEAFDPNLNPIRAKVSLGFRVLSVDDLGFDHRGGGIYLGYQRAKEALATAAPSATLGTLGLSGIP